MGTPENIVENMSLYQMNQNQIQEFLAGLDGAVANQVADFLKDHEKVKRPRGRPAKNTPKAEEKKEEAVQAPVVAEEEPVKKKRGRPAKTTPKAEEKKEEPVPAVAVEEAVAVVAVEEPAKKKRGRPAKNTPKAEEKKEEPVPAVAEEVPKERKPRKEKEEVK